MTPQQKAESQEQATRAAIDSFNQAFNRHDADGLAALLTEDTVFEDTSPAPDGRRIEGKAAVVEFWRAWFLRNPDAQFEAEDVIVSRQPRHRALGLPQGAQRSALAPARRRHFYRKRWQSGRKARLREGLKAEGTKPFPDRNV
jgi:hypothetical protein